MGLAFLNKKSWHTGSFQNIEKVWIAEQKKKEQDRHQAELLKKLKEERHMEELKKLQVEAGMIPAAHLNRMDWMYQGTAANIEKKSEEFLLGKKVTEKEIENKKGAFVPTYKEEIGNIKNEEFTKLHEDPLYLIAQEEMKRKQEIFDNPIKMRDIYDELEKLKKEKKKKKKHKKEHRREKDSKQGEEKERTKGESRERKKNKKEKKEKKEKHKKHSRSRSRSHSPDKSTKSGRTDQTSSSKQSKFYQEYLQKRLGTILVKDEEGNLKPDFSLFKKKHRSRSEEMSLKEKDELLQKMKKDAEELREERKKFVEREEKKEKEEVRTGKFLREMKKDIYGGEKNINELGERVGRNINYYGRLRDESDTFKRK